MFLHKYKDESGTFYALTGSVNPNNVKLLAKSVTNTIPADRVSNFLENIEAAFREKPEEAKKKKKADSIRKLARILISLDNKV